MQHISETINLQGQQQEAPNSTTISKSLQAELVIKIFAEMQIFYNHMFTSSYPTREQRLSAMDKWSKHLADMTEEQVNHALANLPANMPNPAQFIELGQGNSSQHKSAAYRPFDKSIALEHKADKEKAKHALSEIRQMVGV